MTQLDGGTSADEGRAVTLQRHAGRAMARRLLDGIGMREHRLRTCGYTIGAGRAWRRGDDGRVRSVGVERCGNSRACPVCGPAVAAVRAAEIGAATWRWMTAGDDRHAVFVSLAASHRPGDRLADLHDQLVTARAAVMRSDCESWRRWRRRFGVVDLAWRIEHNVGNNGPHPGAHFILLTDRWWTAEDAQQAEAWLLLRFRAELAAAGFAGRLSSEHGIDVRPVDDPAGIGQYLSKWSVGAEMAGEHTKSGRVETSIPYATIPTTLAVTLGRHDPYGRHYIRDLWTRRLVDAWGDYVRLAVADKRKWYRGFRRLRELVPELHDATNDREKIAVCTAVLPEELRPARHDDAEVADDDDQGDGQGIDIDGDAWRAALHVWFTPTLLPWQWHRRRRRWFTEDMVPVIPLELAVAWLAEDDGPEVAAYALAELAGGTVTRDPVGWRIALPEN